jgi:hypothetical protein
MPEIMAEDPARGRRLRASQAQIRRPGRSIEVARAIEGRRSQPLERAY